MTTSASPLHKLKKQADNIAAIMKAVDRGEFVPSDPAGKIAASKAKGEVKFGIFMDDKIVMVTMSWTLIRETSEAAISEWIINYMRGQKPTVQ